MNDYIQYVHNLKGLSRYDHFRLPTREAIVSLLLRQIEDSNALERTILKETDREVLNFISSYLTLKLIGNSVILSTDTSSYVEEVDFNNVHAIINLRRIDHTQHPNKLFRAVNTLLPKGGLYIGTIETYTNRKSTLLKKYGKRFGQLAYFVDFIVHRVIPRLKLLEEPYKRFTKRLIHRISGSEILGRLVYCGFDIVDFRAINGLSYIIARKVKAPLNMKNSSYYPFIKLSRIGRNGILFGMYKIRTMHPYSEYIQDYIIRTNGYDDNGKPAKDYRIARWGIFLRKWWIDELPQLINVLKGEMKLVGLRPLSQVRFDEFPDDLKTERIKYKPGCIPPYVALCMPDDEGRIEAERIYIGELKNHPYTTDIKYLGKAMFNIIFNKAACC